MPASVDREEFRSAILDVRTDIRDAAKGVHDRLDKLNGRTQANETKLALLEERLNGHAKNAAAGARWWSGLARGSAIGVIVLVAEWLVNHLHLKP